MQHDATPPTRTEPPWLTSLVAAEPRAPLILPYMAYLVLLAFMDWFPVRMLPVAIALHIGIGLWATFLFRNHWPPLGRPHLLIATVAGVAAAALWVKGQHLLNGVSVGGYDLGSRLFLYPAHAKPYNPHTDFGDGTLFWVYAVLKIARACSVVPIVEELFWRGFILRAFVNWHRPESVPLGAFAWKAMIGSALLSTIQHPDAWGVSIACWLFFNALFYWKKSLLMLMITHAVTNLVLYAYVIRAGDWQFW